MAKHRTGYLFRRGKTFYVRWTVNGKFFSKALYDANGDPITHRREAEEARAKLMAPFAVADEAAALETVTAKLEGRRAELAQLEDQINPPLALTRAWSEYVKAPNRPDTGQATLRQYGFQFGAFLDWMREQHPELETLRGVTKGIAEEYAAHLQESGFSANTFNKHLNLLGLVFRVLKEKARISENPWLDIQRKRMAPHTRRELTVDELRKVCDSATGELRTLLALGVYTGLRLGDCATLRWSEVDLPRAVIRRVPNKTARSRPDKIVHVPIHPTLASIMAVIPSDQREDFVLPETSALYTRRIDLVTDLVQRHFVACGIKPHKPGTGENGKRAVIEVGFHSLRHTFVSLCRESNAPLAVVESIVGHSNPAMTRHYTHVGELAAGRAVAALPAVVGDTTPQQAKIEPEALLREVKAGIESMAAENWREKKAALLVMLAAVGNGQPTVEARN
ncbi:MAG: tyrosine-type recombinase/integrase [Verrucomicrobiia bacterium]